MFSREQIAAYIYLLEGESSYLFSSEVISKQMAYETLKEWTDEDYGYDTEAWEEYFSRFDLDSIDQMMIAFKGRTRRIEEQNNQSDKEI